MIGLHFSVMGICDNLSSFNMNLIPMYVKGPLKYGHLRGQIFSLNLTL